MKVASAGRRVAPRWPISEPGPFRKTSGSSCALEGELLGVVGVVEAERDHRADLERRQPDDLVLGDDAAVGEADRIGAAPASLRGARPA